VKLALEATEAQRKTLDYALPEDFHLDNLYAQLYPVTGNAKAHKDPFLQWVASVSIGEACEFSFGTKQHNGSLPNRVRLSSGDLIFFNGGEVFHAVTKILPDTAPPFWKNKEVETFGYARLNLQCRDRSKTARNVPPEWGKNFDI